MAPDSQQVLQRSLRMIEELRAREDEFKRRDEEVLAALAERKQAIEADWQTERRTYCSPSAASAPGGLNLAGLQEIFRAKRDALLGQALESCESTRAELRKKFEEEKAEHSKKWVALLNDFPLDGSSGADEPSDGLRGPTTAKVVPVSRDSATAPIYPRSPNQFLGPSAPQQPPASSPLSASSQQVHYTYGPSPRPNTNGIPQAHNPRLPIPPTVPSQPILPPHSSLPSAQQQPPLQPQAYQQSQPQPQGPAPVFYGQPLRHPHQLPVRPQPATSHQPNSHQRQTWPQQYPVHSQQSQQAQSPQAQPQQAQSQQAPPQPPQPQATYAPGMATGPSQPGPATGAPLRAPSSGTPSVMEPPRATHRHPLPTAAKRPASPDIQPPKSPGQDPKAEGHAQKRARIEEKEKRTISYDEVFDNGNAKYKHWIVEYPLHTKKFYILRCDQHGVHFNNNPLHGAAKHLHSAQHGHMSKERAQAVAILGYQVLPCDAELAAKNNEAFEKALQRGYKIFNMNQVSKTMRRSMGFTDGPERARPAARAHRVSRSSSGIISAIAGELYLAYWKQDKKRYPAMVLPLGDLKMCGLTGSLFQTGLLNSTPSCYLLDPTTKQITGWNPEVDEIKREFPVLYFDSQNETPAGSVGWARGKDLSPFDFNDPNAKEIPFYDQARNHYAKCRGFTDFEHMAREHPSRIPRREDAAEARTTAPASEDREMTDVAAPVEDSDFDSASRPASDSGSDVEMGDIDSRRTSVSNRGEAAEKENLDAKKKKDGEDEAAAKGAVHCAKKGHDAGAGPSDSGKQASNIEAGTTELSPRQNDSGQPSPTPGLLSLAETAKRSLERASPASEASQQSGDVRAGGSAGSSSRRVEKIYAHSNPNRASKGPRPAGAATPECRADAPSLQPTSVPSITQVEKPPAAATSAQQDLPSPNSSTNTATATTALTDIRTNNNGGPSAPSLSRSIQGDRTRTGSSSPSRVNYRNHLGNGNSDPANTRISTNDSSHAKAADSNPARTDNSGPTRSSGSSNADPAFVHQTTSKTLITSNNTTTRTRIPNPLQLSGHCSLQPQAPSAAVEPSPPSLPSTQETRNQQQTGDTGRAESSGPGPRPRSFGLPSTSGTPASSSAPTPQHSPGISAPQIFVKRESSSFATNLQEVFEVGIPSETDPGNVEAKVRLTVDPETNMASSSSSLSSSPSSLLIDPHKIKTIRVEGPASKRVAKIMEADSSGQRQLMLIFEHSDCGLGVQAGHIHARRFCRWVQTVEPSVDIISERVERPIVLE